MNRVLLSLGGLFLWLGAVFLAPWVILGVVAYFIVAAVRIGWDLGRHWGDDPK